MEMVFLTSTSKPASKMYVSQAKLAFVLSHSPINLNTSFRQTRHHRKLTTARSKPMRTNRRSNLRLCNEGERQTTKPIGISSVYRKLTRRVLGGFDPSPELAAILLVYFVQGALDISRLAISFFLKDELHLSPAECAALTGVSTLPWLIKPLYGFLTDTLPLFGYRRRSYLIGAGAIGVAAWAWLATGVDSALTALLASLCASLSVAISDVVVDSVVVERVRDLPPEREGTLQSLCWGTSAVGSLLSAYFSGSLLQTLRPRDVFALTAILPFGTSLLAGMITEKRVKSRKVSDILPDARSRSGSVISALRNRSVYLPVAFIFAWQAMPSSESALFFFSTNELGFGPEFLGRVKLVSSTVAIIGLWMYRTYLREVELKSFFFWAVLVSVPLSLTQVILVTRSNIPLGISDKLFALTDSAVLTALGQVVWVPVLVLAARMCPPGIEGTLFAALMSIFNASGAASTELGALLTKALGVSETNFDNLWLLVVVCSFSNLLPLPFIHLVDEVKQGTETNEEQKVRDDNDHLRAISPTASEKVSVNQSVSKGSPNDFL